MSYSKVIEEIENLPHFKEFVCPKCGVKQRAFILRIQADCQACKTRVKLRGYGAIGSEIEDVIDSVLAWIGDGEVLEEALLRKKEITQDEE